MPARRNYFMFLENDDPPGGDVLACNQIALSENLLQAENNAVGRVYWYSSSSVPVRDIASLYGMHRSAWEYDSSIEQTGKLILGIDDANCPREDISCVIIEDELYNPAELCIQFASRGREASVVAVVSPRYALRNYIRDNIQEFYTHIQKIAQTFPAYCMSERNAILQMMWNMERGRFDETDIRAICNLLGQRRLESELWNQGNIDCQVLARKFRMYSGVENIEYYLHYEHKFQNHHTVYEFWLDAIPASCHDRKLPCYYACASLSGEKRALPQYSKIQLIQSYLPGQIVSLGGENYEVIDIVEGDCEVDMYVRRNAQRLRLRNEYHQRRTITVASFNETDDIMSYSFAEDKDSSGSKITVRMLTALTMDVVVEGYWAVHGEDLLDTYVHLPAATRERFHHRFHQKKIIYIELDALCSESRTGEGPEDAYNRLTATLMTNLNELFRTVYSEYKNQLLVCRFTELSRGSPISMENIPWGNPVENIDTNCFCIVEDSEEDIGLLDSILMHFDRLLHIIADAGGNFAL